MGGDHTEVTEISQNWPTSPRPRGSRPYNLDKGPQRDSGQDKVPILPPPIPWELSVEMGALEAGWSRDPPVTTWRTPLLTTRHLARMRGKCLWEPPGGRVYLLLLQKWGQTGKSETQVNPTLQCRHGLDDMLLRNENGGSSASCLPI